MEGIIATDAVRNGIGDIDILEATGTNLVVIVRVTPRAEAIIVGVGKDRRMVKVRGIWFTVRAEPNALQVKNR